MRTSTLKHLSQAILALAFTSWAFAATAPIGTVTVGGGTGGGSTPIATTQYPGKVKPDGTTVTVETDGTIHAVPPLATTSSPGAVKVGTGLSVSPDGTLNNTGVAGVATFNGRGGSVKPGFSDYSASMIKGLASVAKTGAYGDLTGKPTIPAAQVSSDWNAASGVAQILNKPTIPSALAQLTQSPSFRTVTDTEKATWNAVTAAPVTKVNGKTGDVTLTATDVGADALGSATSVQDTLSAAIDAKPSVKAVSGGTYQATPATIYVGSTTPGAPGSADFWLDTTTSVSPVCISGSYNDLTDKPTSLGGGAWGGITGTLSEQTDLWSQFQLYMLKSAHDTYAAAVQVKFDNMSTQFHALRTAVANAGIDITPPVLTRVTPSSATTTSTTDNYTIKYTVTDDKGLDATHPLQYQVGGGPLTDLTSGADAVLSGFTANTPTTIHVVAKNAAGMTSADDTTFTYAPAAYSVSDDFNRTSGTSIGSNWTAIAGQTIPTITASQAIQGVGSGKSGAYWSTANHAFAANQCSKIKITTLDPDNQGAALRVSTTDETYYSVKVTTAATATLQKRVAGGTLQTVKTWTLASNFVAGDTIKACVSGSTFSLYHNDLAEATTATDTTIAAGQPGILGYHSVYRMDDWAGSEL